jgi:hypothetical protein
VEEVFVAWLKDKYASAEGAFRVCPRLSESEAIVIGAAPQHAGVSMPSGTPEAI